MNTKEMAEMIKPLGDLVNYSLEYFGYDGIEINDGKIGNGLIVFYTNYPIESDYQLSSAINLSIVDWQVWFIGNRVVFSKIYKKTKGEDVWITKDEVIRKLDKFPLYVHP